MLHRPPRGGMKLRSHSQGRRRVGGRRGAGIDGWGLVFGLLDPGKVGVQFGHRVTTGAFWARMTFKAIHFPALLLNDSLIPFYLDVSFRLL